MITCIVGSGGKTTLIKQLAHTYLSEGKKVLITTTTHMYIEDNTLVTDDAALIIEKLQKNHFAFVGKACEDDKKITSLSEETFQKVITYADEILIEADGSKQLPLKFPNTNEPVLVPNCDHTIVVTSLSALHKRADEVIHRLKYAQNYLEIAPNKIITAMDIQQLLRKGYLEPFMNNHIEPEIYVTTDGSLYQRALASLIKANMDVELLDENWFAKKPCLFICGAGHVAKELADIASFLDFRITVMDSREQFANKERFPYAEKIICSSFEDLSLHLEDNTFYAVVTPGHQDDYTCVKKILGSNYTYLGMIGSHRKIATTFEKLKNDGYSNEQINSIHAPIGLSIGAVTPGEIAISILAEIIDIKNRKSTSSVSSELLRSQEKGVLCIIIDKTGSAPRGIGSMMLVTDSGQIDTLGGGAIENQVISDAKTIDTPFIKEYNLGPSDSAKLGMICGGTNKILFIPIDSI